MPIKLTYHCISSGIYLLYNPGCLSRIRRLVRFVYIDDKPHLLGERFVAENHIDLINHNKHVRVCLIATFCQTRAEAATSVGYLKKYPNVLLQKNILLIF